MKLLYSTIVMVVLYTNQVVAQKANYPFYYQMARTASTAFNSSSSQDVDLINYDSNQCVCDKTYYKDYDCSCDPDSTSPGAQSYSDTSRLFTLEKSYLLTGYPYCDTLRNNINKVIPSQINNIACLVAVNTPYNGYFYDTVADLGSVNTQLISQTALVGTKSQFNNYNISDFVQRYQNSFNTMASNPSQIVTKGVLKYAPDFFGFCRLVPILKRDILNYGAPCNGQSGSATQNRIVLSSDDNGIYSVSSQTATLAATNSIEISVGLTAVTASSITPNDQGYSYSDYLTVSGAQSTYRFGGMFYLTTTTLTVQILKIYSTGTTIQCTGIAAGSTTQQYIIYYTTLGTMDNTSYQITQCKAATLLSNAPVVATGRILVTFQYQSFANILSESSYSDRLSKFVTSLFYPLSQFTYSPLLAHSLFYLVLFLYVILF